MKYGDFMQGKNCFTELNYKNKSGAEITSRHRFYGRSSYRLTI